jgi:HPt (histidine-containing phosphotransfer) domain-containing protein
MNILFKKNSLSNILENDDSILFIKLYKEFLNSLDDFSAYLLHIKIIKNEYKSLLAYAHKIKSSAEAVGALALHNELTLIEDYVVRRDERKVFLSIGSVITIISDTKEIIKKEIDHISLKVCND